jgi:hypothetical protein
MIRTDPLDAAVAPATQPDTWPPSPTAGPGAPTPPRPKSSNPCTAAPNGAQNAATYPTRCVSAHSHNGGAVAREEFRSMSERTARWLVVLIPLSQPVLIFLLYLRPPSPGRTIALIGVLIVAVAARR